MKGKNIVYPIAIAVGLGVASAAKADVVADDSTYFVGNWGGINSIKYDPNLPRANNVIFYTDTLGGFHERVVFARVFNQTNANYVNSTGDGLYVGANDRRCQYIPNQSYLFVGNGVGEDSINVNNSVKRGIPLPQRISGVESPLEKLANSNKGKLKAVTFGNNYVAFISDGKKNTQISIYDVTGREIGQVMEGQMIRLGNGVYFGSNGTSVAKAVPR